MRLEAVNFLQTLHLSWKCFETSFEMWIVYRSDRCCKAADLHGFSLKSGSKEEAGLQCVLQGY